MMLVRAIYQNGNLKLLDTVDLEDGQEVQLQIVDKPQSTRELIQDLLVDFEDEPEDIDEEAIQNDLDQVLRGTRPLSEMIIEERQQGR